MPLRFDCFLQKHQPEDVWNQRFTVLLKSAIFVWHILKKHVFMIAIQSYSLALFQHRHSTDTQIKTQSSYQNIFYSALKFHWSDLNDDTWKWCELQRKTKMLGEPIAGAAGLTLWHRPCPCDMLGGISVLECFEYRKVKNKRNRYKISDF